MCGLLFAKWKLELRDTFNRIVCSRLKTSKNIIQLFYS